MILFKFSIRNFGSSVSVTESYALFKHTKQNHLSKERNPGTATKPTIFTHNMPSEMYSSRSEAQDKLGNQQTATSDLTAKTNFLRQPCRVLRLSSPHRRCPLHYHPNTKAYRTLAAIQDKAASVDARRQLRQSDRYTLPTSVTSNARTQQFSARCSIHSKASTREDKLSKWLHPASPPIKTIIWWCSAAGVDAVMLRGEEKTNKRRRTVWS